MDNNPELLDIDWLNEPTYREVISKERLLKDIKTNLISLLNDYKGRGIENEERLIDEVKKMFTGGVVPSLVDWKILNLVLQELSEVKEQGAMYRHFIRDVSDSLGVNDLKKIRNFIEYITTLAPLSPIVNFEVDSFNKYVIKNLKATFSNNIENANISNYATLTWDVEKPRKTPYLRVSIEDSKSEDVFEYKIKIKAGLYKKELRVSAKEIDENQKLEEEIEIQNRVIYVNIPLDNSEWGNQEENNISIELDVETIDKRGNKSTINEKKIFPAKNGIPKGFNKFQIYYKPSPSRNWQEVAGTIEGDKRKSNSIRMTKIDGYHQFGIVGFDKGLSTPDNPEGEQERVESPRYNLRFRDKPTPPPPTPPQPEPEPKPEPKPGTPNVTITNTTTDSISFRWNHTSNTEYYAVRFRNDKTGYLSTYKNVGKSTSHTFSGSRISPNQGHMIFVSAYNKDYPEGVTGARYAYTQEAAKAPGTPSPVITKVTYNRVDFKWAPTENTDYYTIKFRNDKTGFVRDDYRVEQSSSPSQWFQPGISPDAGHRIFVTAHNKWYPDGLTGTVYVNTPKAPIQTITYRATGSKRYIGQKYYGDEKGYRRGTGPTVYNTGNKNRGLYWTSGEKSMPQAHWRETAPHGYKWRSGGSYQAHYGQSHGNNLSLFQFDYNKIRRDMKDKEIVSVEIRVKREGSPHGWANIGRPLYLYNYSRDSVNAVYDQNGREVTYNNNTATFNFNFKQGAVRTANNTNSKKLFENIVNNGMRGLALFHYDTAWFNSKPPIANPKYLRLVTSDTQFTVKYRNT